MRTDQLVENHEDLLGVIDGLLGEMGLDRRDTGGKVTFAGLDPLRPTVLKTGAASAAVAGAGAIAFAILWRERGGEEQDIHIDLRKAYAYQSPWQDVLEDCTLINGSSGLVRPGYVNPFNPSASSPGSPPRSRCRRLPNTGPIRFSCQLAPAGPSGCLRPS